MNTIKKTVSVLLAVMMIFSMLTIVSVSAAETNTITVTSNLCDAAEYTYDEDDAQIKVTYKFQSDKMILNAQGVLTYDNTVLQLADGTTSISTMPVLGKGSAVANFGLENKVKFNSTSLDLFDFTTEDVFFTVTFDIIGSGNTTVDLDVEVITATTAKNYEDVLAGAEDIDLVYFGSYATDLFTASLEAEVTEASTVSVFGDINLELAETEEADIYTGVIELQAGTYKFNVNNNGTTHGMNYTYTDTAVIDYSAGYKAQSTLKVSGGRYTFTFNAATKKLTIKYKSFDDIVELVGDINAELVRPKKTSTVFTGSIRLDAGTYKFNVNEHGTTFGNGSTFTDSIYNIGFTWTAAATFIATGGIYSVRYDTSNNQLKILKAPDGLGDVSIFGDLSLPLAEQGNGIYSAQTTLEAGSYQFRVDALGTTMCNGSTFTDTMSNIPYSSSWKAASTFTASSKMKFTFIFDANENTLKVFNSAIDTSKVLVAIDNTTLELKKGADGIYTATKALTAGTYSIRMDEFGVTMGYGGNFTDSYAAQYNASFKAATTFTATGGNYTFAFNTNTNTLTVKKA